MLLKKKYLHEWHNVLFLHHQPITLKTIVWAKMVSAVSSVANIIYTNK